MEGTGTDIIFEEMPEDEMKIIKSLMKEEPDLITYDDDFGGKLYLGNLAVAAKKETLKLLRIQVILQVSGEDTLPMYPGEFQYHCFTFGDNPTTTLTPHITRAIRIIKKAFADGKSVLVHCAAGVSRSASLVIAFIMIIREWDYEKALAFVKERRACVSPNEGFERELKKWKKEKIY